MKKKKRRKTQIKKIILSVFLLLLAMALLGGILFLTREMVRNREIGKSTDLPVSEKKGIEEEPGTGETPQKEDTEDVSEAVEELQDHVETEPENPVTVQAGDQTFYGGYDMYADENTAQIEGDAEILSKHAILVDLTDGHITAEKDADVMIYPASMTKILTILVAAEQIPDLDAYTTIPGESVEYCLKNGCSAAGFVTGEKLPVRDLFYGTILPSGGEAAVALAIHTAGSHEAFVDLMNQKLSELQMADTAHMTNCVGVFDEAHYCTMQNMAMILKAAEENDFCREVLRTRVYETTKTEQNSEGIILSNWFLRRIEDKDCHGTVSGAKTGFVSQSGDCAASYLVSSSGTPYICVTADTYSSWRCIYDHVTMYQRYTQ